MLKRRHRQLKVVKKPEVIDVDKYEPSQKSQNEKFWIWKLNLLERDRDILLNPAGFDSIIDVAQEPLKQAFPALSGLQSVCCGLTMNFDIEPSELVQVIHNGRGHWLMISTIGIQQHVSLSKHSRESTDCCNSSYRITSNLHAIHELQAATLSHHPYILCHFATYAHHKTLYMHLVYSYALNE